MFFFSSNNINNVMGLIVWIIRNFLHSKEQQQQQALAQNNPFSHFIPAALQWFVVDNLLHPWTEEQHNGQYPQHNPDSQVSSAHFLFLFLLALSSKRLKPACGVLCPLMRRKGGEFLWTFREGKMDDRGWKES
jgi:hypothetical protein